LRLPTRRTFLLQELAGDTSATPTAALAISPAVAPPPASTPTPSRAGRILIVEDNPVNTLVASRILEKAGYAVATAENGRIAVDTVRTSAFDLIFMDGQMPEMDGFMATSQIRRMTDIKQPVIIGLTALASKADRDRCLAVGMDDYLAKPITAKLLLERAEHFLGATPPTGPAPAAVPASSGGSPSSAIPAATTPAPVPTISTTAATEAPVDTSAEPPLFEPQKVLENLGGDTVAFQYLAGVFRQTTNQHLTRLAEQVAARSSEASRTAHSIKGSALEMGASKLAAAALQLEKLCREERFVEAEAAISELGALWQAIDTALQAHLKTLIH